MTELLRTAVDRISKLPAEEQDAIARWILAEIDAERRWDRSLAGSADRLQDMAKEARGEYRAGDSQDLDPDEQ